LGGDKTNTYRILVQTIRGEDQREDNIQMDLRKVSLMMGGQYRAVRLASVLAEFNFRVDSTTTEFYFLTHFFMNCHLTNVCSAVANKDIQLKLQRLKYGDI
jgi:hypothetical protein